MAWSINGPDQRTVEKWSREVKNSGTVASTRLPFHSFFFLFLLALRRGFVRLCAWYIYFFLTSRRSADPVLLWIKKKKKAKKRSGNGEANAGSYLVSVVFCWSRVTKRDWSGCVQLFVAVCWWSATATVVQITSYHKLSLYLMSPLNCFIALSFILTTAYFPLK